MEHHAQNTAAERVSAVLLVNLGSPDEPNPAAIARYLQEFLSDRRVVDLPKWLWQPILRGIILRRRPVKLAPKYQAIWQIEGAPLKAITAQQARGLQARLQDIQVYWAMRYQNPSIENVLRDMQQAGHRQIGIIPMYPQFSYTTTATVEDAVDAAIRANNLSLSCQWIRDYHAHPAYIEAMVKHIQAFWQVHGKPDFVNGERLILSVHGLPKRNIQRGDPYQQQSEVTYRALCKGLGLDEAHVVLAYQSRFGAQKWIEPATQTVLERLRDQACTRVDVFCPGFSADCLETLEEVGQELKEVFCEKGGQYHAIPCLNDVEPHIQMLETLCNTFHQPSLPEVISIK